MGRKAVETGRNINPAFGEENVNESTAQHGLRRFRNGDKSLQDEERRGRPLAIDDSQLRAIVEADPLKTTGDVAEELNVVHSTVVRHLHQMGKSKKLDKCCIERRSWSVLGARQVESSTTTSWILAKTITAMKYCKKINKMHQELQHLCPALANRKGPILLHDNALLHVSLMTVQKFHELAYETLPYSAY
uniref:HTH_48 domain-containing protein n=1 Tax=Heterorhabditis bacteriophora TaxID=37862 RepID=A0A1I7WYL7_HETBA